MARLVRVIPAELWSCQRTGLKFQKRRISLWYGNDLFIGPDYLLFACALLIMCVVMGFIGLPNANVLWIHVYI